MYAISCSNNTLISTNIITTNSVVYLKLFQININVEHTNFSSNNLISLIWSHSNLEDICFKFTMYSLQIFNVALNQMYFLHPYCFFELQNVAILLLDRNKLTILKMNALARLRKLQILDLSCNNLEYLSSSVF